MFIRLFRLAMSHEASSTATVASAKFIPSDAVQCAYTYMYIVDEAGTSGEHFTVADKEHAYCIFAPRRGRAEFASLAPTRFLR